VTTDTKRLTLDEIALLREVFRWARDHDVTRTAWGDAWKQGRKGKMVTRDENAIGWAADRWSDFHWLTVDSIAQAVDVLVAVGHLPQRFSSAYLAGWNALAVWRGSDRSDRAEFRRLFHDPENISFPVGEYR
jgi:hypothetical protein